MIINIKEIPTFKVGDIFYAGEEGTRCTYIIVKKHCNEFCDLVQISLAERQKGYQTRSDYIEKYPIASLYEIRGAKKMPWRTLSFSSELDVIRMDRTKGYSTFYIILSHNIVLSVFESYNSCACGECKPVDVVSGWGVGQRYLNKEKFTGVIELTDGAK